MGSVRPLSGVVILLLVQVYKVSREEDRSLNPTCSSTHPPTVTQAHICRDICRGAAQNETILFTVIRGANSSPTGAREEKLNKRSTLEIQQNTVAGWDDRRAHCLSRGESCAQFQLAGPRKAAGPFAASFPDLPRATGTLDCYAISPCYSNAA